MWPLIELSLANGTSVEMAQSPQLSNLSCLIFRLASACSFPASLWKQCVKDGRTQASAWSRSLCLSVSRHQQNRNERERNSHCVKHLYAGIHLLQSGRPNNTSGTTSQKKEKWNDSWNPLAMRNIPALVGKKHEQKLLDWLTFERMDGSWTKSTISTLRVPCSNILINNNENDLHSWFILSSYLPDTKLST